jgi:hypothetical protein
MNSMKKINNLNEIKIGQIYKIDYFECIMIVEVITDIIPILGGCVKTKILLTNSDIWRLGHNFPIQSRDFINKDVNIYEYEFNEL